MNILIISANTETINMTVLPVGAAAVAEAVKAAGHNAELLDLLREKSPSEAIAAAIARLKPQIIGISVRNIDDQASGNTRFLLEKVKDVIRVCRANSGAPIVLGGAGYSIFPERALAFLDADYGIQGDGEAPFIELIKRIDSGAQVSDIPGLHIKGGPCNKPIWNEDLDCLPMPDPKMWESYKSGAEEIAVPLQTRRGCPMRCSYCSTWLIQGERTRKLSLDKVAATIAGYVESGFKLFHFVDNTFNIPYSYAMKICRMIIDRRFDIRWRCIIYPSDVDEALVKTMAEAGCVEVAIGFESGVDEIIKSFNKKFNTAKVREISDLFGKYHVYRMGFLMLGGPGETKDTVIRSLEFADSLKLEMMRLTAGIRIYPNTKLAEVAVHEGVISADDDLLIPKFYLKKELDGWLQETIKEWSSTRRGWII